MKVPGPQGQVQGKYRFRQCLGKHTGFTSWLVPGLHSLCSPLRSQPNSSHRRWIRHSSVQDQQGRNFNRRRLALPTRRAQEAAVGSGQATGGHHATAYGSGLTSQMLATTCWIGHGNTRGLLDASGEEYSEFEEWGEPQRKSTPSPSCIVIA